MDFKTSSAWTTVGNQSQNLSQNVRMPAPGEGVDQHEPKPTSPEPLSAATSRSSSLTSISGIDEEFDNIFDQMMRQFSRRSSTQLMAIIQDQTSEAAIWQTSTSWKQINHGAECLQKEAVVEWKERTACHLKAQIRFRAQRELDRRVDNKRWAGAQLEDYLNPTGGMMQSDAPGNPAQASKRPTWRCPYGHTYCHGIESRQEFLCCARCINNANVPRRADAHPNGQTSKNTAVPKEDNPDLKIDFSNIKKRSSGIGPVLCRGLHRGTNERVKKGGLYHRTC